MEYDGNTRNRRRGRGIMIARKALFKFLNDTGLMSRI